MSRARKIKYPKIGNFYAEENFRGGSGEWNVYSENGDYVGHVVITGNEGIIFYPRNAGDYNPITSSGWEGHADFLDVGGTLENAVRFIYLNWQKIKKQFESNKLRGEVRSIMEAEFNSIYGTERTSYCGSNVPGPDPFSPAALGTDVIQWDVDDIRDLGESELDELTNIYLDQPEPFSDGALGVSYLPEVKKKKRKDEDAEGTVYVSGTGGLSLWPVRWTKSDLWFVDAPNKWTIGQISDHGVFVFIDPTQPGPARSSIELDIDSKDKIRAARLIYLKHLEIMKGKKLPKSLAVARKGNVSEGRLKPKMIRGKKVYVFEPLSREEKQVASGRITFKGNPDLHAKINAETPGMVSWWVYNVNERIAIINLERHMEGYFRFWRIYVRDKAGQTWDELKLEEDDIRRAINLAYLTWAERYGTRKNPLTENTNRDIRRIKLRNIPELTVVIDKSNHPETWWVIIKKEDRQKQSIAYISPRNKGKKDAKWLVRVKPDEKTNNPFYWKKEHVEPKDLQSAVRLAYLKWMENISSVKQEISESLSKWPEHVQYPTLGDVTAVRQSDDAQWWAFMDTEGKYIGTYKVNPENLAKELKLAAERAYYKWLDNKSFTLKSATPSQEPMNESSFKTGYPTLDITDLEKRRALENNAPQGIDALRMAEFFINKLDGCEIIKDKRWPDSTFYRKNGEVLFEKNVKDKVFYVDYYQIWSVFEREYSQQYYEIQSLIKNILESSGKFIGFTPGLRYASLTFNWKVVENL